MGVSIRLLGRPEIIDDSGICQSLKGQQSWALLARILLGDHPLDRHEIASELYPETADPLASLRWCLADLRRALGSSDVLTGDPIVANLPPSTTIDLNSLDSADLNLDSLGPFLDGINPRTSPALESWLLVQRERYSSLIGARVRRETMQAISMGNYSRGSELAELGVRRNPLDEGAHILLLKCFTLAGLFDAAKNHLLNTETVFIAELGVKPTAAVYSAALQNISARPEGISPRAVIRSLIDSGKAALSAGAIETGVDCLRRAAVDAEQCKDQDLYAESLLQLGSALIHSIRGYDDEGAVFLRQAAEVAKNCDNASILTESYSELGYVDALAGRRPSATFHLKEALKLTDDHASLAGIYGVMGFNLIDWGKFEEGLNNYEISLEHARLSSDRRREAFSLGLGGWGQIAAGNMELAQTWLTDSLKLIEELNWLSFSPWPRALLLETKLKSDHNPASLRSDIEQVYALSCQLGDPCWEGVSARVMSLSFSANEEFDPAIEWLQKGLISCVRETDIYVALLVDILAIKCDLLAQSGQYSEAANTARELLPLAAKTHMDHYLHTAIELLD
jgi:DNA-binding SARP family transcriptional activator